ncbi:Uncharacterised protein [Yersinia enterocolitica]|uniref:Uncharacterized protein n=1 Tax=Yersinia enterocolitica TaxID=630 RepID=A0ABP1Y6F3_YEREN|nr:Uncharacterised protein [Yersinia enterocolitica]CQD73417.1 Uncharacterised protein [Yersinia enterocolitica]CRX86302.1 Uncharacterised protein [Yersinia enterocolitica]
MTIFCLPGEWGEIAIFITPVRFANDINQEWQNDKEQCGSDQNTDIFCWATYRNLAGWNKAEYESQN